MSRRRRSRPPREVSPLAGPTPPRSRYVTAFAWAAGLEGLLLAGVAGAGAVTGNGTIFLLALALGVAGFALTVGAVNARLVPAAPDTGKPDDAAASLLAALAIFGAPLVCTLGDEGFAVLRRGVAAGVAVAEAPARREHALLEVVGVGRHDLMGVVGLEPDPESDTATRFVPRPRYAVPLVPASQAQLEPVHVWLVSDARPPEWSTDRGVVEDVRAGDWWFGWHSRESFGLAVAQAELEHGLRSAPDALLVQVVGPLDDEVRARLAWLGVTLGVLPLVAIVVVLRRWPEATAALAPAPPGAPD